VFELDRYDEEQNYILVVRKLEKHVDSENHMKTTNSYLTCWLVIHAVITVWVTGCSTNNILSTYCFANSLSSLKQPITADGSNYTSQSQHRAVQFTSTRTCLHSSHSTRLDFVQMHRLTVKLKDGRPTGQTTGHCSQRVRSLPLAHHLA